MRNPFSMSSRPWTQVLLSLSAVALAACGNGSDDSNGAAAADYDFSAVDAEVEAFLADEGAEGVGLIIVHRDHGVVHHRGYGAYGSDRIALIASSSKMVTAGVLMRLHDQGVLDIDAPVADVASWGAGNPTITPAQLLSNSSGLVPLSPNPTYGPYLCQYVFTGTMQECAEQIFTTTADDDLVIPPDTRFQYGGGQWQVAGAVAEVASGKSWAELMDETYTQPCGLEVMAFNNHFVQITAADGNAFGYPAGFDSNPANLMPTENPNMEGGAYTTTGDYGKLLLMHLRGGMCDGGRVLSEESVARMHENRIGNVYGGSTSDDGTGGYGLGWWVPADLPGITFDPGAYGAFPWIDMDRGYGAYIQVEASSGLGSRLFGRILDLTEAAIDGAE